MLCWIVAGLSEDLTQIPMLTSWDIVLLQECFETLYVVTVPSELVVGLRCPAVITHTTDGRSSESCWWSEQMDCSRAGRSADCCFGTKLGEFETVVAEMQAFMHERAGQHLIVGERGHNATTRSGSSFTPTAAPVGSTLPYLDR